VNVILLFHACAQLRNEKALNYAKQIAGQMSNSFYVNPRLVTSLLDALMKCGDMKYAQSLFNSLTNKTLSMYGAMIKGIRQIDQFSSLFNKKMCFFFFS
jgi:hypothetical protein